MLPRYRRLLVTAMLGVAAAALVACSGDSEPAPEPTPSAEQNASEQPLERAADGLPVDFPRDDVPVVEGKVASATGPTKDFDGYTVLILADGDPTTVIGDAVAKLESAGWQAKTQPSGDQPTAQLLTRDSGRVILTIAEERGQTALSYSVSLPQ